MFLPIGSDSETLSGQNAGVTACIYSHAPPLDTGQQRHALTDTLGALHSSSVGPILVTIYL